jgi:hypothetical protein
MTRIGDGQRTIDMFALRKTKIEIQPEETNECRHASRDKANDDHGRFQSGANHGRLLNEKKRNNNNKNNRCLNVSP